MSIIEGEKGKKGGASVPDDTLKSRAYLQLIDAISEGPIESIDEILINRTSSANITDAQYQVRAGLPDDEPLAGFNTTESFVSVGTDIDYAISPIIRTINDQTLDAIKVYVTLNVIYKLDKKGALKVADTGWRVDVKAAGGSWVEVVTQDLDGQKVTSPVQFEHLINLPGTGPWDIRVRPRFTAERDKHEERMQWTGYATVVNGKNIYPHTAHVGMMFSAEYVGSSMPTRHYKGKFRKILVPTNYDPITRVYTGVWDGTFKRAWSNCPPWVLYDLVENNVFGVGDHIDISSVNKWRLYTIAQYCDQLVPSGYKNSSGVKVMEPRYTFNGAITNKQQALDAFRSITAVWRGMGFYGLSQLYTTADMPQDPAYIYGPANVVDGRFEYSSSSIKSRHSVVLVRYNDPNNLFEPAIEPVIDEDALAEIGWRETTLELAGCSSRSLAHRYGRWVIETEKSETETVSFGVSLDSIQALPGEVIAISDPRRVRARLTGRIVSRSGTGATITLDKPVPDSITGTVSLRIQKADGSLLTVTGGTIAANRANITVPTAQRAAVIAGVRENAVYILSSAAVDARLFRILSIEEEPSSGADTVLFRINALEYDATKFARVEQGINFDPLPVAVPTPTTIPPTDITFESRAYTDGGQIRNDIEVKWKAPAGALVKEYRVYVTTPALANIPIGVTGQNSITYSTYEPGSYQFRIIAVSYTGTFSDPLVGNFTVAGLTSINVGVVSDFVNAATLLGGTTTFAGQDVRMSWRNMMSVSSIAGLEEVDSDSAIYSHTSLEFYFGATKVRTQRVTGNSFIYTLDMNKADAAAIGLTTAQRAFTVRAAIVDKSGRVSPQTVLNLSNPVPAMFNPTVSSVGNIINVQWQAPQDTDLAGVQVWVETASGFNPLVTTPKFDGAGGFFSFTGLPSQAYLVRAAAYDTFGKTSLNICPEISISTGRDLADTVAPNKVTGLVLASAIVGTAARLTATWVASAALDILGYEVEIKQGAGSYIAFSTAQSRHEWDVLAATSYTVRVRAIDRSGNKGTYSDEITHTAIKDTTPPAVPAGLTVSGGFASLLVKWNEVADADLLEYEVYESTTTTAPVAGTAATYTSLGSMLSITSYTAGAIRHFWVRAVDTSGNKSAWSARVQGTALSLEGSVPAVAVPTGLAVTSAVTVRADGGIVSMLQASWSAVTDAVSYQLSITRTGAAEVIIPVGGTTFEVAAFPNVLHSLKVQSVNSAGVKSAFSSVVTHTTAADAVAPAVPAGLTATAGFGTILLKWTPNTEYDFSNYGIYESATATAPAVGAAPTYRSASPVMSLTGMADGLLRYYWVRAYDTSGNASAWSSVTSATTASLGSTQAAPGVPATPTLSTILVARENGTFSSIIKATWTASANSVTYEVEITRSGTNPTVITGQSPMEFEAIPGLSYSIAVRGVNSVGAKSALSTAAVISAVGDTVAPAVPTGLTATGGFESVWLTMARNAESDFAFYEIYESAITTAPVAGTAATFTSRSETMVRSGLTGAAVTRHYWARAVDTSGNKSAWSARVPATTVIEALTSERIAGLINTTSFAAGLTAIEVLPALPATGNFLGRQVMLTTDNKLYRHLGTPTNASGFTRATDGADLVADSIQTGSIAAGAIKAAQIDAGAVTASKMLIGDTSNIINDPDCMDVAAWSLTGGTISVAATASNIASRNQVNATASTDTQVITSSIFPVEPGKPFWVSGFLGRGSGDTVAQDYELAVEFFSNQLGTISLGEILVAAVTTASAATRSGQVTAPATGRRARLVARKIASGGASIGMRLGAPIVRRANNGELIVDGAITAIHVGANEVIANSANIKDAVITNAKINDLSAAKIIGGTALLGTVTVSGTALTDIKADAATGAQDPATRINAAVTKIDPGKIVVSGATTLADWRGVTDTTTINGGKLETDSISARSIKIGALPNLVQNGDFSDTTELPDVYFTSTQGTVAWETDPAHLYMNSPVLRMTKTLSTSTHNVFGKGIKRFNVVPGETLAVEAVIKGASATAVGLYVRLRWVDAAGVAITPVTTNLLTNAPIVASYTKYEGQIVVPALAVSASIDFLNHSTQTTNLILYIGKVRVQRASGTIDITDGAITGAKLIATENVITASAQIKDAVITNAHINDLSAAKLIAGTALAGTITVSTRALSDINTDAALGAQNPATRINSGVTQIDPGKIVISGPTTLADWRGVTDTTTINGGKLETDSITARTMKIGTLPNLIQNGDFSDTTITPANYWVNSGGSTAWETGAAHLYMGSAVLRMTKTASTSNHLAYVNPTKRFAVVPGEKIAIEAAVKGVVAVAVGLWVRVVWYDSAGALIGVPTEIVANVAIPTVYTKYGDQVTVPAGAATAELRFVNSSSQTTNLILYIGMARAQRTSGTIDITDGAITGAKLISTENVITTGAQIKDAIIAEAHITGTLSAAKLTAGTALAGTITVSSRALTTINADAALGAQDPATRVNAGSTQIDPGKIVISGATTLADWRNGSDTTTIEGGKIAANTVSANKMEIGSRNLTVTGIVFEHNDPNPNRVSWTAGVIRYINDAGAAVSASITANTAGTLWSSGIIYIYWVKGATALSTTTTQTNAFGINNVLLATYAGGTLLTTDKGRTIIDGSGIKTGTISTEHIDTDGLSANIIKTGFMDAQRLTVTKLLKITTGTGALSVGKNSAFDLDNDGIYFGRTLGSGGVYGFGLLAGKKVGGVDQYIQATDQTGLKLVNANHFVTGTAAATTVNVATSQTVTLPVGTSILSLNILGGGGGGKGGGTSAAPTAGGATTVQLWNGAVNTGISWSSAGGPGASSGSVNGESSPLGAGGGPSAAASGYGAGGGGGNGRAGTPGSGGGGGNDPVPAIPSGAGGAAADMVQITGLDISAYANPKLVIVIGAAGVGTTGSYSNGANGSPGVVQYMAQTVTLVPASVLPINPTYTGSLSKANGGLLTFPNYGAGLWCLSGTGAGLQVGWVKTHASGAQVRLWEDNFATFVSDITPVDLTADGGAISYTYQFYKLGSWV